MPAMPVAAAPEAQVGSPPTLLCASARSYPPITHAVTKEEYVDQQVRHFFAARPEVTRRHKIAHRGGGVYELDGRKVFIEYQPPRQMEPQGRLVVVDGPLRQPLSDYLDRTEANAEYEAVVADLGVRSVHLIPRERRLSFDDKNQAYSRLDAMKVAKEQALVREKAAGYLQAGKAPPQDLMTSYARTLQIKLAPPQLDKIRERSALPM